MYVCMNNTGTYGLHSVYDVLAIAEVELQTAGSHPQDIAKKTLLKSSERHAGKESEELANDRIPVSFLLAGEKSAPIRKTCGLVRL